MEDPKNISNRKATIGRPPATEIAKRIAEPVQPVKIRRIVIEDGVQCPACHQAMKPYVRRTVSGILRYMQCPKCSAELVHDIPADTVRVLRGDG